jgi:cellulose synthase/poly-beta-1,6-N-acetylglucosamine synthase-like glycosyltransferase
MIICNIGGMAWIILINLWPSPKRVWDIFRCFPSYIFHTGTYIHTLMIFAFANIDDVSWGTKGLILTNCIVK